MLTSPKNHYIPPLINAATRLNFIYTQMPILASHHLKKLSPSARKKGQEFLSLTQTMAIDRELQELDPVTERGKKKDLFSHLIHAVDPLTNTKFTPNELWAEAKTLLVAGSDTTALGLASTLFYLTRPQNQEALQTLTIEILSSFPDGVQSITLSNPFLNKCHYLRACIDEAMRITPPASIAMMREVETSPTPVLIAGHPVPAGTDVGTCIYAIHHNESYFPSSYTFSPSRWLVSPSNPPRKIQLAREALLTFQYGPRSCAGRALALTEIRLVLARMVWLFEMRAARGEVGRIGEGGRSKEWGRNREGELQVRSHVTGCFEGPWVEFRRRRGGG
jgi:cytochrome P450